MSQVFLDLDGTLVDPAPGITGAFIHALETLGLAAPAPEALSWVIGPALVDSFARMGAPDPQAALALYRERYSSGGLFDASVYDGIPQALRTMAEGHRLFLATAKPHVYAARVTAHFGLDAFLNAQFGPELDGTRNDKAELLAHALATTGGDPARAVMVGDRKYDRDAARAVGMRFVGVTWGYGDTVELEGADALCGSPARLAETVRSLLA